MGELATIHSGQKSGGIGLPAVTAPPSPAEWEAMKQQARVIAESGLAPKNVNTVQKVLVIALKGRELSIPPMQALSQIHIVEGKPTLSAELMAALVQRAGHKLRVLETSSKKCVVEGVRADDPGHPSRAEWTMEDARMAGVANKGPWKSYPAAMLRARAISALCRFAFADVLMGASYTPEELGAEVNEEGQVLSVPEPRPRDTGLGRGDAAPRDEEPIEEAEVVADDDRAAHREVLGEVRELLKAVSAETVPNKDQVWKYAHESYDKARATRQRLRRKLEEENDGTKAAEREGDPEPPADEERPFESDPEPPLDDEEPPVDVEGMRGSARRSRPDGRAHKSQVDILLSLCRELAGEEGVRSLIKQAGKPVEELTVEEADYYIERYSPKEGS